MTIPRLVPALMVALACVGSAPLLAAGEEPATKSPFATTLRLDGDGLAEEQLAPQEPDAEKKRWRFDVALYLWMADLSGTMDIGSLSAEADAGFEDLTESLSGAFMLHAEAWRRDKLGFLFDFAWMEFQDERTRTDASTTIKGESTVGLAFVEGAIATRFRDEDFAFDFFMGVRVINLSAELDLESLGDAKKERWLFDPMIGARILFEPTGWLFLTARADVAGFGIGTQITGNVAGYVGYRLGSTVALLIGYRAMSLNFEDSSFDANVRMHGPVIAFDLGF